MRMKESVLRTTAILLLIFFVIGMLAACGNTEKPAATTVIKPAGASWYKDAVWNEDGALKILAVGHSFSNDSMQFVYEVAKAAGVKNVELGNLYIAGCKLNEHLANAQNDAPAYKYYYTDEDGLWESVESYKMSDAVKSKDWDFVFFQQEPYLAQVASSYDDLKPLMDIVVPLCTNPKVEFAWHMTWAYQADYGDTGYDGQMRMYNGIVSAVQEKIVTDNRITKIIPNGTAVQNARTTTYGDKFTRDGYHLTYDTGRILAAMTTVEALVGIDWETFDFSQVEYIYFDPVYYRVASTCAKDAVKTPFKITKQ